MFDLYDFLHLNVALFSIWLIWRVVNSPFNFEGWLEKRKFNARRRKYHNILRRLEVSSLPALPDEGIIGLDLQTDDFKEGSFLPVVSSQTGWVKESKLCGKTERRRNVSFKTLASLPPDMVKHVREIEKEDPAFYCGYLDVGDFIQVSKIIGRTALITVVSIGEHGLKREHGLILEIDLEDLRNWAKEALQMDQKVIQKQLKTLIAFAEADERYEYQDPARVLRKSELTKSNSRHSDSDNTDVITAGVIAAAADDT